MGYCTMSYSICQTLLMGDYMPHDIVIDLFHTTQDAHAMFLQRSFQTDIAYSLTQYPLTGFAWTSQYLMRYLSTNLDVSCRSHEYRGTHL